MTLTENSLSFRSLEEEDPEQLESQRLDYIEKMKQKFELMLNKEIRDLENKDMTRRQIKSDKNEEKKFDFLKIKAI